jgi:hypothetical protein
MTATDSLNTPNSFACFKTIMSPLYYQALSNLLSVFETQVLICCTTCIYDKTCTVHRQIIKVIKYIQHYNEKKDYQNAKAK